MLIDVNFQTLKNENCKLNKKTCIDRKIIKSKFHEIINLSFTWKLFLLEVKWTESFFWGPRVAHYFCRKVLWQLKEIGLSLFYTFQFQASEDFNCERNSHLFPTAFQTLTDCRNILFASNTRVFFLFCHC